jgi:hypothetical protein
MIFDRFLKKSEPLKTKEKTTMPINNTTSTCSLPDDKESDFDVLVLWWISKKKKGYDRSSNKFPKWFAKNYGIDFNRCINKYCDHNCLSDEDGIIKITEAGMNMLRENDYVVYIHEHPQYGFTLKDFKTAPNLHKVQNSDIAWGVFNTRLLEYTQRQMWNSLALNHGNMANLLIEEKKYEQALDFIFATAFLETSGMEDNNEVTAIMEEMTSKGWKDTYLPNGMPNIFLLEINNYNVTVPFIKAMEALNLDWSEIKERFLQSRQIKSLEGILPFRYFEKEESFEIFKQAIEAGGEKGIFPLEDCNKKLKWNRPDKHSNTYFYANTDNQLKRKGY